MVYFLVVPHLLLGLVVLAVLMVAAVAVRAPLDVRLAGEVEKWAGFRLPIMQKVLGINPAYANKTGFLFFLVCHSFLFISKFFIKAKKVLKNSPCNDILFSLQENFMTSSTKHFL